MKNAVKDLLKEDRLAPSEIPRFALVEEGNWTDEREKPGREFT